MRLDAAPSPIPHSPDDARNPTGCFSGVCDVFEQGFLSGTVSSELREAVRAIAEETMYGKLRFRPSVLATLLRLLAARQVGPALFKLHHLIRAFMWSNRSRRGAWPTRIVMLAPVDRLACAAYFHSVSAETHISLNIAEDRVILSYPDGDFSIQFHSMPILIALFSFVMDISRLDGGDYAGRHFDGLSEVRLTYRAVQDLSNALTRRIDALLNKHTMSHQTLRLFLAIIRFLSSRGRETATGSNEADMLRRIDDDAIFAFWDNQAGGSVDAIQFAKVAADFNRFAATWNFAGVILRARPGALSYDEARLAAFSRETFADAACTTDNNEGRDTTWILEQLARPPAAAIKVFTGPEHRLVQFVEHLQPLSRTLPRTLLRVLVFTPLQNRLIHIKGHGADATALAAMIESGPKATYGTEIAALEALVGHCGAVSLAIYGVLLECRHAQSVHALKHLRPETNITALTSMLNPVGQPEDEDDEEARLVAHLDDPTAVGADLAALATDARRARRSMRRAGFEPGCEHVEGHAAAMDAVAALKNRVAAVLRCLAPTANNTWLDWDEVTERDTAAFQRVLKKIYCSNGERSP